jgi:hypothetical protein
VVLDFAQNQEIQSTMTLLKFWYSTLLFFNDDEQHGSRSGTTNPDPSSVGTVRKEGVLVPE